MPRYSDPACPARTEGSDVRGAGLLAGFLLAAAPSAALAEPWPAFDWVGHCSPYSLGDCVLEPAATGPDLDQLRAAGMRFQRMGFRAPALELEPGNPPAYPVYFAKGGSLRRVEAGFSAELCLAEDMYAEPDESTCQPLSGAIETRVLLPSES